MSDEWMMEKIRRADVRFAKLLGLDPSVVVQDSLVVDIYGRTARWSEATPDGPVRRQRDVTPDEITALVDAAQSEEVGGE